MESLPDAEILITADHGMSSKSRMIHLPAELLRHGIQAQAVPIIKDMYTVHHSNLGGCIYLYVDDKDLEQAVRILNDLDGVDQALNREDAAQRGPGLVHPGRGGAVGPEGVVGEGRWWSTMPSGIW